MLMKLLPAFLLFLSLRLRALAAGEVSMELVTEHLPTIDKLLEELELTHLAEKFYSSGFTETQYILRMKDMDLRIMAMEWGVDKDQIMRVKEAIQNYKIEREVVEVVEDPLLKERNGLKYGKLVVNRSTTSYEVRQNPTPPPFFFLPRPAAHSSHPPLFISLSTSLPTSAPPCRLLSCRSHSRRTNLRATYLGPPTRRAPCSLLLEAGAPFWTRR